MSFQKSKFDAIEALESVNKCCDDSESEGFVNIVPKPLLHPSTGVYTGPLNVRIDGETENVRFHYTLNGSDPNLFSRYCDKDPTGITFEKSGHFVLKVIAVLPALPPSEIAMADYYVTGN